MSKVIRMIRILDKCVPSDAPTEIEEVTSQKGFHGVRVSGATGGRAWSIDLYGGNFYLMRIEGLRDTDMRTPIGVVNFLRAHLLRP